MLFSVEERRHLATPGMHNISRVGLYTIFGYQYGMVYGMHKGSGGGGSYIEH